MSVPVPEYVPDFRPTHVVPRAGLDTWEAPDPGLPTTPLDAFLPVRLEERAGDWGRILCSNGWTAWVDARLLVSVPDDPPAAGRALTRTADPRPLIARAEDALGRYRRAAEALGAGSLDGENFRLRTRGLRVGMVVDGESVWLYDAEHERWVYCDGVGLSTYAASAAPSVTDAAPAPEAAPEPATAFAPDAGPEPATAPEPVTAFVPDAAGPEPPQPPQPPESAEPREPPESPEPHEEPEAPDAPARKPAPAAPPAYEPTQVVPQVDPSAAAGPPPTQVVERPPGPAGES